MAERGPGWEPGTGGVAVDPEDYETDDVSSVKHGFTPYPVLTAGTLSKWATTLMLEDDEGPVNVNPYSVAPLIKELEIELPFGPEKDLVRFMVRRSKKSTVLRIKITDPAGLDDLDDSFRKYDDYSMNNEPRWFPPAVELTVAAPIPIPNSYDRTKPAVFDVGVASYTEIHTPGVTGSWVVAKPFVEKVEGQFELLKSVTLKHASPDAMMQMIEVVDPIFFSRNCGYNTLTMSDGSKSPSPTMFYEMLTEIARSNDVDCAADGGWDIALAITTDKPIKSINIQDYGDARLETITLLVELGPRFTALDLSALVDLNDYDLDRIAAGCPNLVSIGLRNLGIRVPIVEDRRHQHEIRDIDSTYGEQRAGYAAGAQIDMAFETRITDDGIVTALAKLPMLTSIDLSLDIHRLSASRLISASTVALLERDGTVTVDYTNRDSYDEGEASPGYYTDDEAEASPGHHYDTDEESVGVMFEDEEEEEYQQEFKRRRPEETSTEARIVYL